METAAHTRASVCFAVGAIWLATALIAPAFGQTTGRADARHRTDTAPDVKVTETHIMLFKYALNLRHDQQSYWMPVEAALRELAQRPAADAAEQSSPRAGGSQGSNSRYKRLSAAAIPLIKTFDENQRRNLQLLSRTFGFEHWLASR